MSASTFRLRDGELHAEDVPLGEIAARFGTPTFVYSKAALEGAYREYDAAFAGTSFQAFAGVLAAYALFPDDSGRIQGQVISGTFALSGVGVVALVGSRGRQVSWVVFFFVAALVWLGLP